MAGKPGRSGGSNKLSAETHRLRGTLAYVPKVIQPSAPNTAAVPAQLLEGIGPRGAAFIAAAWERDQVWSAPRLVLLREAGMLIDWIEAHRGKKGEQAAQRLLLAMLATLEQRRAEPAAGASPASKWGT